VSACEFRAWDSGSGQDEVLARLAGDHDLKHSRCTSLVTEDEYTLQIADAPEVPQSELRAAMRWRIKDIIGYNVTDAVVDVFDVPGERATGRPRNVFVVVSPREVIESRVKRLTAAGIGLDVIDIPELAQRNLASVLPEDEQGVVMLSLGAMGGLITISRRGEIYLSRNLEVGLESVAEGGDHTELFARVALEVQRSLDYYDSHFRQAPLMYLAILPTPREIPGLVEYLQNNLGLRVEILNPQSVFDFETDVSRDVVQRCLPTLGAALRDEGARS
jgi:MSHA biogenesis protein MshI